MAPNVILTPTSEWSTLSMLPIRITVDASEEAQLVELPETTSVLGGATQLVISVVDTTETVSIVASGDSTVNGEESAVSLLNPGDYVVIIGSNGNWLITAPFIASE